MASMVPVGMDFWASRRSPERLEPAMMPGMRADDAQCSPQQYGSCQAQCEPCVLQVTGSAVFQDKQRAQSLQWSWHCHDSGSQSTLPYAPQHFPSPGRSLRPLKD